jgi:hypothetical protein
MIKKEDLEIVEVVKSVTTVNNFSGIAILPWDFYAAHDFYADGHYVNIESERYGLLEAYIAKKQGWTK